MSRHPLFSALPGSRLRTSLMPYVFLSAAAQAGDDYSALSRSSGITFIGVPGKGGTAMSVRGFSGHSSTLQRYDGSRLYLGAGTVTLPVDAWAAEHIDALRVPDLGPYATGSAAAAVAKVSPKTPFAGAVSNRLRLGYGSHERRQMALESGGAFTDTLSYRLNLSALASNGRIDQSASASNTVSGLLRWQPNDDLRITLSHDHADQDPALYMGNLVVNRQLRHTLRDYNYSFDNLELRFENQSTRLVTDWVVRDNLTASNQLYVIRTQGFGRNSVPGRWVPAYQRWQRSALDIEHTQEQMGNRQSFTFQHALFGLNSQSVAGADYIWTHFTRRYGFDGSYAHALPVASSGRGTYFHLDPIHVREAIQTRHFSLFAENRTQLTERLSLISGVRHDQGHLKRSDLRTGMRSERSLNGSHWRGGLVFALNEQVSVYGQHASGTEGMISLPTLGAAQQQWNLSPARQSEVGIKQVLPEGRGEWSLAAFHIVKKKLLSTDTSNSAVHHLIGEQSSNGIEASLALRLPYGVRLSANAAWVRAEYDEFGGDANTYSGNRPVSVPQHSANLWLSKGFGQRVTGAVAARYVDSRYADEANTIEVPSYEVFDAQVSWQVQPDLALGLQVKNLFNRRYAATVGDYGRQWYFGAPRAFLVTIDHTF